jgi:hypothetical protein
MLEVLSDIYHLHGLDRAPKRGLDALEESDALPRIVCSEALVSRNPGGDETDD